MKRLISLGVLGTYFWLQKQLSRAKTVDLVACIVLFVIQHLQPVVTKKESAVYESTTDLWEGGFVR